MNSFLLALLVGGSGLALLTVVALSGLKVIKIGYKAHRALGLAALGIAVLHGLAALLVYLGLF